MRGREGSHNKDSSGPIYPSPTMRRALGEVRSFIISFDPHYHHLLRQDRWLHYRDEETGLRGAVTCSKITRLVSGRTGT